MMFSKMVMRWSLVALFATFGNPAAHCQQKGTPDERRAGELFRASRYPQAEALFQSERADAQRRGDSKTYLRLTLNLASCRYAQFDYRGAVGLFEDVRTQAAESGELETAGVALINLSSVYSSLWEPDASDASLRQAGRYLGPSSRFFAALKTQESAMEARRMDLAAAMSAAREAVSAADAHGDASLVAQVWNRAGLMFLAMNRLDEAERYLTEAFRLRRLQKLPLLESSYRSLARLRLRQGRPADARNLLDAAQAAHATAPTRGAQWAWEADKAAVQAANGETLLAKRTYASALAQARTWRSAILPVQSSILASEVSAAQIAEDYANLLAVESLPGGTDASALAGLRVLETARSEAFQSELIHAAWRQQILGADYARALAGMRKAEASLLLRQDAVTLNEARKWRAEVATLEARMGVSSHGVPPVGRNRERRERVAGPTFDRADSRRPSAGSMPTPPPDEAWFSFKLGPRRSWLWIVTSSRTRVVALPGAASIAALSAQLRSAIASNGDWLTPAATLNDALFSSLSPSEAAKPHWRLSLDGPLYEIPFAALARPSPDGRQPLALSHTFTTVPSLFAPSDGSIPARIRGRFVGVGDAVYNQSDSRLNAAVRPNPRTFPWFALGAAASRDPGEWDLPRLPGAAREIQSAAEIFKAAGTQCSLLTGGGVSLDSITRELANPPSILHFAAHVLSAPDSTGTIALSRSSLLQDSQIVRPGEVFIALGRGPGGRQQLLSSTSVASRFRADNAVIVLSGCGSAQGTALPGAGLQGMTRAWLAARARSVVGSLWTQPDSSEPFFQYLYGSLVQGNELRFALQAAQTAMLRSRDWRSQPRHWAGWILVGKER